MTYSISLISDLEKVKEDYKRDLTELRRSKRRFIESLSQLDAEEIDLLLKIKMIDADISALKKEESLL